jgi:hypothetical protein
LITDLHNSNKPLVQTTLSDEIVPEEKYYLLGFVNGKDLLADENIWFFILNPEPLDSLKNCLKEKNFL